MESQNFRVGRYSVYPRSCGKKTVWYYSYYDETGKRIRESTRKTNAIAAEEYVTNLLLKEYEEKKRRRERSRALTFGEFAKDFFCWGESEWVRRQHARGKKLKKVSVKLRQAHIDNYLLPIFCDDPLDAITAIRFENEVLFKLPLSNSTLNGILYTMKIIMRHAKRLGKIEKNPIEEIEPLSTKDYKRRDILTEEELNLAFPEDKEKFIEIWPYPLYGVMYATIVSPGMRSGEQF